VSKENSIGLDLVDATPSYNQSWEEYWQEYREKYFKVYGEYPAEPAKEK
jgi:hypothetical protein